MNSIIVGYGEIGKAVEETISNYDHVGIIDPLIQSQKMPSNVEVMHICFPYSEDFIKQAIEYKAHYQPNHIIIWSTVPIGTTQLIRGAVHSPVEGKHPDLALSIHYMTRWIGANNKDEALFFNSYFIDLGLKTHVIDSSDYTEALKLLSTTEYGVNIEFARYKQHVANKIGMDYQLTKDWNQDYNQLYKDLGLVKKFQKFVLDAPDGPKGGHCVTPNAELLHDLFPSELTKIVGEL